MPPIPQSDLDRFVRVVHLIAGAIAASVLIYVVIAWLIAPTLGPTGMEPQTTRLIAVIFGVLSIGHLIAARTFFSSRLRSAATLPLPEQRLESYRIGFIIAFALREAIAIYGLALSFLSGDVIWVVVFGAVSLMSMLLDWPRRSDIERLASTVPPIG